MDNPTQNKDNASPEKSRVYAGKYQSPEALEQGYMNSSREAQRLKAENDAMAAQVAQYQTLVAQFSQSRPNETDDLAAKLEEAGISLDTFRQFVKQEAAEETSRLLTPLMNSAEAVTHLDDSQRANQFLRNNPEVQATFTELVSANPRAAAEYLQTKMQLSTAHEQEGSLAAEHQAANTARESALRDAGVPQSQAEAQSSARDKSPVPSDQLAREKALVEAARQPGGAMAEQAYLKSRLGGVIEGWFPGDTAPKKI